MHIYFIDQPDYLAAKHLDLLKRLGDFTATFEQIPKEAEVSVSFVHNDVIRELNRTYRQKDRPTDVLSFALEDSDDFPIKGETLPLVLGDIVISIDQTKEQAHQYNHSFERELSFLFIHGLLHLLGYDHMNKEEERVMFQRQEEILGEFNLERT